MEKKMTKRALQALQTRNRIFDCAITLFSEHGFDAVKIEDICSAANVSNGLFYNYFPSKDALLLEYLEKINVGYAKLHDEFKEGQTSFERLRAWARTNMTVGDIGDKEGLRFLYAFSLRNPEESFMSDPTRTSHQTVYEIVSYGQERGEIRTDLSQNQIVHFIEAHFWGCFFAHFIKMDHDLPFNEIIETELKLICNALTPPDNSSH